MKRIREEEEVASLWGICFQLPVFVIYMSSRLRENGCSDHHEMLRVDHSPQMMTLNFGQIRSKSTLLGQKNVSAENNLFKTDKASWAYAVHRMKTAC